MSDRELSNIAASVRQRLLNRAQATSIAFADLVKRYVAERLLIRICQSAYHEQFVLKGAHLFTIWMPAPHRITRDLDLLHYGSSSVPHVEALFRDICMQSPVPPDGVIFLSETVRGDTIRQDAIYAGVRIELFYQLGTMRDRLQIDIGFGDDVTPTPLLTTFPPLLNYPGPSVFAYSRETAIAEKFEAMVTLGIRNSRMKDLFDIWVLARNFTFDGETLCQALRATFTRRDIPLPTTPPLVLTTTFTEDSAKRAQWRAFIRKGRLLDNPIELAEIAAVIAKFLLPPVFALSVGDSFPHQWIPEEGWGEMT